MTECLISAQPPKYTWQEGWIQLEQARKVILATFLPSSLQKPLSPGQRQAHHRQATRPLHNPTAMLPAWATLAVGKQVQGWKPRGLISSGETLAICKYQASLCSSRDWSR